MLDFQDLLQDAEQMKAHIDKENAAGIPRLQRNLTQIYDENRRKLIRNNASMAAAAGSPASGANFTRYDDSSEINASILLAAKGVDAPRLTQHIENLHVVESSYRAAQTAAAAAAGSSSSQQPKTLKTLQQQQQQQAGGADYYDRFACMDELKELDLVAFLRGEKESALMAIIEETRSNTIKRVEDSFAASSEAAWKSHKQRIMQDLHGTSFGSGGGAASLTAVDGSMMSRFQQQQQRSVTGS